ncbi:nucleotidyltransferase family protein [Ponticaulis sp.]|uniref:nucleotidyltransferase family protein n=1 Tax=Ponticaulis sp. TaxID=2020902 RepID=UPI00260EC158|nr:nucleotidyltransferase family protein [Ponticaulis sp.]MDF1679324.1 nucleotidyltransferase family protein [Ponticaulis sp.]
MGQPIRTAMFLAAGLGSRMRPLSNETPKPLIKVAGKALMDYYLDQAVEAGVERVVVNVHWLPEQVEAHMAARTDVEVVLSDEREELLETGGAIVKARKLLGDDPIFMVNTDAFFASGNGNPFAALAASYDPTRMDDLLLLADRTTSIGFPGPGDFYLKEGGQLERRGDRETAPWAYAGARITKASLYDGEALRPFSANIIWNRILTENRLFGLPFKGQWMHVGEPATIQEVEDWMRTHPTA